MNRSFRQSVTLHLDYEVHFTRGLFASNTSLLAPVMHGADRKLMVCVDDQVAKAHPNLPTQIRQWNAHCPDAARLVAIELVDGGEQIKNAPDVLDTIANQVRAHGMCRHSFIMAIGGGAVLDAVGFAASLIHRGIHLIRVPTTVLSMNDSGIGVKNGINRFSCKNFYGVFQPAKAVFCDFDFLQTLPDRIWISGLAEAFKVAVIRDREFLDYLLTHTHALRTRESDAEEHMILRTAQNHMAHITQGGDPFERGSSRPLDFGHWSAHRLETLTDFALLHGEAVAIGIAVDLFYAAELGMISDDDAVRVCTALEQVGLPIYHPFLTHRQADVLAGLEEFREHLGGNLTVSMPGPLGKQHDIHEVNSNRIQTAIANLAAFSAR